MPAPQIQNNDAVSKKNEIIAEYIRLIGIYKRIITNGNIDIDSNNPYFKKMFITLAGIVNYLNTLKRIFRNPDFYDDFDESLFGLIRDTLENALNNSTDPTAGGLSNANRSTSTNTFKNLIDKINDLQKKYDDQNISNLLNLIGERVKEFCSTVYTTEAKSLLTNNIKNDLYNKIEDLFPDESISNVNPVNNDKNIEELTSLINSIKTAFDNNVGQFSIGDMSLDIRYLSQYSTELKSVFGQVAGYISSDNNINTETLAKCGYGELYELTDKFGKVLSNVDKDLADIKLNDIRRELKNRLKKIYQYLIHIDFRSVSDRQKQELIEACNGFNDKASWNPGALEPRDIIALQSIIDMGVRSIRDPDTKKIGLQALKILLSLYRQYFSKAGVDMVIDDLMHYHV